MPLNDPISQQMAKKTAEVKQKIAEIESLITQKQETLDMQKDLFLDAKQEQLTKLSKLDEFDEEVVLLSKILSLR